MCTITPYNWFNVTLDPLHSTVINLPNSGGGGGGGINNPVKNKKHQCKSETSAAINYTCQS